MKSSTRYSEEVKQRAVRMVMDHTPEHGSQWAAIRSISQKIGVQLRRYGSGFDEQNVMREFDPA